MSFEDNIANNDCLIDELGTHLDEVVTICTEGCCFTGLLVAVDSHLVKLITRCQHGCPCPNLFGKTTLIPVREIEAVTFCNTSS